MLAPLLAARRPINRTNCPGRRKPMTTVVVVVLVFLLLVAALRLWTTANRLDRLHVRTEAAWSALEGALARRVVAARAVAATGGLPPEQAAKLRRVADAAD